ncbi:MAG: RNA polymerase sigma-70 factor [Sediminibacterium sp.]
MTEQNLYEDKALFLRIAQGDEASFTELFHGYTPKLLAYLVKITRDERLARELVQETLLKIWIKREHLQHVSSPSAYLFRLAGNLATDYFREERARRKLYGRMPVTEESPFMDTGEVIAAREVAGIIARAVEALPGRQQEVYRLSREQGLSHEEIAARMNISVSTVNNQIGTALKSLAGIIAKETGLSAAVTLVLLAI